MLLPVLEFQKEACKPHYEALAKYCGVPDFLQAIRQLMTACGMDRIVSPVKEEDIPQLRRKVVADSINYSAPVTLRNEDIEQILKDLCTQKNP
jgi:alcohol dehydrogenase class IV